MTQLTARRRDRRVYLAAHPVLFALLAASRHRPVRRVGRRTLLVHSAAACRHALTRLPLDRAAAGTTGQVARAALRGADDADNGVFFDQRGEAHRAARRTFAAGLSAAGVERLRPVRAEVLERGLAPLADGGSVDLVPLARELAGATAAALLHAEADPRRLAALALDAARTAVRGHLPGVPRPRAAAAAELAADRLRSVLGDDDGAAARAMLAVASVTTVAAALPRAVAWCADADCWEQAADDGQRAVLVDELLRVTAPSPVLPRVAAGHGTVGGCPVRPGDRLLLVARHAVGAHTDAPDARRPADPAVSQLVFGAGPHACPGARLARAQLAEALAALAPYRPAVVRARADRRAALPGWRSLVIRPREEG